jgi:hypothetical protein
MKRLINQILFSVAISLLVGCSPYESYFSGVRIMQYSNIEYEGKDGVVKDNVVKVEKKGDKIYLTLKMWFDSDGEPSAPWVSRYNDNTAYLNFISRTPREKGAYYKHLIVKLKHSKVNRYKILYIYNQDQGDVSNPIILENIK